MTAAANPVTATPTPSSPADVDEAQPLDGPAHLRRELALLELRLRREVLLVRAARGGAVRHDELAGLVISDEEIDRFATSAHDETGARTALDGRVARETAALAHAVTAAAQAEQFLPLAYVRAAFMLSPDAYGALVACLAPDLDRRFERYFGYLQDDVTKKRPTVQLLGRLFPSEADPYPPLKRFVLAEGSLVGKRLVEAARREADEGPLAALELRACAGVRRFVLGVAEPDPELRGLARVHDGRPLPSSQTYFRHHAQALARLLDFVRRHERLPNAHVRAPGGCGKEDLILAVADALSARVLELDAADLLSVDAPDFAGWLRGLERELRLEGAFLWIRHADALDEPADGQRLRGLGTFLRARPGVNVLLTGERPAPHALATLGADEPWLKIALPAPSPAERAELWRAAIGEDDARAALASELGAKFKLGPGRMRAALWRLAQDGAREPGGDTFAADLHRACRTESTPTLGTSARKLTPRYGWDDLVVPADVLEQLHEIRNAVRFRARVHGEWAFESKFSLGRGLTVLFSGPSGTGKTMSAEILAGDLGLDLYKIDLAQVVSKYIGETEKSLARVFDEAESAGCILLFDEADALFGKRSEVKDAHDRYANIEIDYLLQRMEEHEGIVVLTTNMLKNLDGAFTRRIQHTIEFPFPDERHREQLWSKVFPEATPRDADLDLPFLAKRFKLSGAHIKNVALASAFAAAAADGAVDMARVIAALRREYRKMGQLVSRSELGPYGHLLRDGASGGEG